jgi:multidrug efflux pump subunit AcrB
MEALQNGYARLLDRLLRIRWPVILAFVAGLLWSVPWLIEAKQEFLPALDEGDVRITLTADEGIDLEEMDRLTRRIETLVAEQPEVEAIFTTVGGFVFGRSSFESANRASLQVLLRPAAERDIGSQEWITRVSGLIRALEIPGLRASLVTRGIRGIRFSQGDDDVSLRIAGENLDTLADLADRVVERLGTVEGLGNIQHSSQDVTREISIRLDPQRAASFGLTIEDIGTVLRFALEGRVVTELIDGDRAVDLLLRLDRIDIAAPGDLDSIVLFSKTEPRRPVRLGDVATVEILAQPATILRDRQQRTVEITASVGDGLTLQQAIESALAAAAQIPLPPGYRLYEAGGLETLKQGQDMSLILLGLALFLVLVAMAVQYESVRNPVIILLSVPFALIGVVLGLQWTELPVSMPVWLGLIMLAGIVVNNAIVLVEFIELERSAGMDARTAILEAARLRLRPILMTTLTTVVGMLPLALALGEGSEMLQPLAVTIVAGLSFSTLVSLVLVPLVYQILAAGTATTMSAGAQDLPPDTLRQ